MSYLPYVKNFRELVAYQKAKTLSKEIFQLTKSFPKSEQFCSTTPTHVIREEAAEYFVGNKKSDESPEN